MQNSHSKDCLSCASIQSQAPTAGQSFGEEWELRMFVSAASPVVLKTSVTASFNVLTFCGFLMERGRPERLLILVGNLSPLICAI